MAAAAGFLLSRRQVPAVVEPGPARTNQPKADAAPAPAAQTRQGRLAAILTDAQRGDRPALRRLLALAKNDPALLEWIEEVWLSRDPAMFITEMLMDLNTLRIGMVEPAAAADAMKQWTRRDPDTALAFALGQPFAARSLLGAAAAEELAGTDLLRALQLCADYRIEPLDPSAFAFVTVPPECRALIRQLPDASDLRRTLVENLVRDLPVEDMLGEISQSLSGFPAQKTISHLLGSNSGRSAAQKQQSLTELIAAAEDPSLAPDIRFGVQKAVAGRYAEIDPAAAVAWAQGPVPASIRKLALESALQKTKDPDLRKQVEAMMPEPAQR